MKEGYLSAVPGNSTPKEYAKPDSGYRFRFPFPDEDKLPFSDIGKFPYERGVPINMELLDGVAGNKGWFITKAYKVTQNNLTAFDAQWSKKLDFDTIDLDFYEDYLKFLQKKRLSENTIGREIKNLKAV